MLQRHSTVLGAPLDRDVHAAHHLDSGDYGREPRAGQRECAPEYSVDAVANEKTPSERLEMNVTRTGGRSLLKDVVHEANDGSGRGGGPKSTAIVVTALRVGQSIQQLGKLAPIEGSEGFGNRGRGRDDGLNVATALEADRLEGVLVERIGHGDAQGHAVVGEGENTSLASEGRIEEAECVGFGCERRTGEWKFQLMCERSSDLVVAADPTRVLVDIFQNETGDPSLDALGRMATDRITVGLTYSTFVDVVSLGTRLLSREPVVADASSLEHDDLQALARANRTGTIVWGSYYQQGDSVHFLAHVTNAARGEELVTIEPVRGPVDAPLAAVERLRDAVMTALATLTDPRLAKWMRYASKPPTFEGYAEYVEGIELHMNNKPGEAIPYFLRAAARDSDFTMALLWAAFAYRDSGEGAPADSILQALNVRRGQLDRLDRLLLDEVEEESIPWIDSP